ncbi:MAG: glycosyltransferase family 2 protein [Chloracidobacterium sp.]|nr:glycosyltransferase family 2 protein [Chloracidobacterium sp.]MDW8218719.1 glycosyltransferase family 2 protein [Acidobacteriota bacterium]
MSLAPYLSFVIPAYNEAERIAPTLTGVGAYFRHQQGGVEVIVVDDGSTDATAVIVAKMQPLLAAQGLALYLLRNPGNHGKGYSVRRGFLQARGDVVVFSDADLSTPLTETPKLLGPLERGECEAVIGSRDLPDSQIGVHQSPWREFAGRSFNRFVRLLTGLPYADTQCGFKAFRREVFTPIFRAQRTTGFAFDVEILYLARKAGVRVLEIPVVWNHAEGSKVGLNWRSIKPFWDVAALCWRDWRGGYAELSATPFPSLSGCTK